MSETLTRTDQQSRYVSELISLHDSVSVRGIETAISSDHLLYSAQRPGGLLVLAARSSGIPQRYLLAIQAFRLAQYLRLRFASPELAYSRALLTEPCPANGEEIHLLVLDADTGTIVRYLSLLGTSDAQPMPLTDPRRSLFPCEVAHGVNLFCHVAQPPELDSSNVWEIKRLVQPSTTAAHGGGQRVRITLEAVFALYTVLSAMAPRIEVLVGDGEEGIAIRRMQRVMRQVTVLEGTAPSLPPDELMYPLYTQREIVKPFVAQVPTSDDLRDMVERFSSAVEDRGPLVAFKLLMKHVNGQLRRVTL
jgi:hypothetical protein